MGGNHLPRVALRLPWAILSSPFRAQDSEGMLHKRDRHGPMRPSSQRSRTHRNSSLPATWFTFTLMPAAYTPMSSVQVSDFEDIRLLIRHERLVCDFCSSSRRFACDFLQIPPHYGHPCRPADSSPCRACGGLAPPSECALPGARIKKTGERSRSPVFSMVRR